MAPSEHSFRNYSEISAAVEDALSQAVDRTSAVGLNAIARALFEKRPELNVDMAQLASQVAEAARARLASRTLPLNQP